MKNTQEKNLKNDNLAAIGIGAMIVFIALILVAAVAAAVIIQTAEKLQQNAQSTGDDTTDEMSGKVQVLNVFVNDDDNFEVYFRLAAGSDDTQDTDILWQVFCDDGAGGMDRLAGDFSDNAVSPLDGTVAVNRVDAGVGYRTTIDGDDGAGNDCGPNALFQNNVKATLYLHVVGGGTTYDVLKVNDDSIGSVVV
jgi:flagellin FlaB